MDISKDYGSMDQTVLQYQIMRKALKKHINTIWRRKMKPDIEVIEQALRAKAGRRGLAIAQGETSPQLKEEMHEIQSLLGRIHDQKNLYAKFKDGTPYVSG